MYIYIIYIYGTAQMQRYTRVFETRECEDPHTRVINTFLRVVGHSPRVL